MRLSRKEGSVMTNDHPVSISRSDTPRPVRRQRRETPTQQFFRMVRRNRWWLLLFLWIAGAWPELLLHVSTATGFRTFLNSGLFLGILFALTPAVILFSILLLIPKRKVSHGIVIGYSAFLYLLCASQLVYYRIFKTFYSFYSMTNGGQVLQFWKVTLEAIWQNILLLLFMALPLLFVILLGKKFFSYKPFRGLQYPIMLAAAGLAFQLLLVLCLPVFGGMSDNSAYGYYHNTSDSYAGINKLGLLTGFRVDMQRFLSGKESTGTMNMSGGNSFDDIAGGNTPSEGTQPTDPESTEPVVPIDTSPNVLDINFDQIIADCNSSAIKEVHVYFSNRTPSNKNAKTGMFAGCNLIQITAEAFSDLVIDKERTPTLYMMQHDGFYFTNYYAPDWHASTSDGEYANLTGTIPRAGNWSFASSIGNYMPLTMCQQLMKQQYMVFAYHNHDYDFYKRDQYLENLGYEYKAYGKGLDVEKCWPESDLEMIDKTTEDYVHSQPFHTYYMTVSGHRNFSFTGNMMSYRNKSYVADLPYSENVRAYLACQQELEKAMALLIERLDEAGVLENTVIVLSADHYPNGLTNEEISELRGHQVETTFELYKSALIIYKKGMTPEVIDTPCYAIDILPTLSNLFGLEFDSRLYIGRDIFSTAPALVIFKDRSWITDKASYDYNSGKVTSFTGEDISSDYINAINNEVNNRLTVSARILDYDYWAKLFG